VFRPIVRRHVVSVSSRIAYLLQRLYDRSEIPFEQLFAGIYDRSELVATFLAVLELIKDKRIQVQDDDALTITALGSAPLPEMNDTTGETE
jgi:segregation and condensation protein A